MTSLPQIEDYSVDEIREASSFSPALKRYLALLGNAPTDDVARLRIQRQRAWCRCVLASFLKRAPTLDICLFWSNVADELIAQAWTLAGGPTEGYAILALGKLGAQELNLSSDVDLIIVRRDGLSVDPKVMREFQAALTTTTELGFCFRVDLTLRPGGKSAPLVPSQGELEYYYGYHGEMWERLAWVRSRHVLGDRALAAEIAKFMDRFSYRRHIDLTLLNDLSLLRKKIQNELVVKDLSEFHLKLSRGAIRDIELFVHSLQIIHGGKIPNVKTVSTTEAITRLREAKFIPASEAEYLSESYWHFRSLENLLQAREDLQAYTISRSTKELHGFHLQELTARASRCDEIVSTLLKVDNSHQMPTTLEDQKVWLKNVGFSVQSADEIWPQIMAATALSRNSQSDEDARHTFLYGFVSRLKPSVNRRERALGFLLDFVRAVRAKASLFSLLNREGKLVDELVSLFEVSPYLAQILTSRPELIDSLFYGAQADIPKDTDDLLAFLVERRLLVEILSAQSFLRDREISALTQQLTHTADDIVKILLDRLCEEQKAKPIDVVALGKWGGRELGFRSDLDFIFVSSAPPTDEQQKVARRLLTWLTQPNRGGIIYNVDLRLRPSGHSGPLLVSRDQLHDYIENKAEPWERQAYLRGRNMSSSDFEFSKLAVRRGLNDEELSRLREIRSKLLKEDGQSLDLKKQPGGLVDIEFESQIALLRGKNFSLDSSTRGMIEYNMGHQAAWTSVGQQLLENYQFLRLVEQMHQLTTATSDHRVNFSSENFSHLADALGLSSDVLKARLSEIFENNNHTLKSLRESL